MRMKQEHFFWRPLRKSKSEADFFATTIFKEGLNERPGCMTDLPVTSSLTRLSFPGTGASQWWAIKKLSKEQNRDQQMFGRNKNFAKKLKINETCDRWKSRLVNKRRNFGLVNREKRCPNVGPHSTMDNILALHPAAPGYFTIQYKTSVDQYWSKVWAWFLKYVDNLQSLY